MALMMMMMTMIIIDYKIVRGLDAHATDVETEPVQI